jgi:hypothetical protein
MYSLSSSILYTGFTHHYEQEMISIDNALKSKLNNYNLVKGSLTQMQRRKMSVILHTRDIVNA